VVVKHIDMVLCLQNETVVHTKHMNCQLAFLWLEVTCGARTTSYAWFFLKMCHIRCCHGQ